jgi:predicted outer membrane repeat protein
MLSPPYIANNTITGNTAGQGGGICCQLCDPAITNNVIARNTASEGGGMASY